MAKDSRSVFAGFTALFGKHLAINTQDGVVQVPVFYARESSDNFAEGRNEQYPQVTILDYDAVFNDTWNQSGKLVAGDLRDTNNDGVLDTASLYEEEKYLDFRYDVGTFTRSFNQKVGLSDFFMRRYSAFGWLTLHPTTPEEEKVYYTLQVSPVPREDGIFEVNYEFTLRVWFDGMPVKDVDVITVELNANPHG